MEYWYKGSVEVCVCVCECVCVDGRVEVDSTRLGPEARQIYTEQNPRRGSRKRPGKYISSKILAGAQVVEAIIAAHCNIILMLMGKVLRVPCNLKV